MFSKHKVTAIIPALNEADSIGLVVSELWEQIDLNQTPLIDQVIVCDNGSEDATAKRAKQAGAKVVQEPRRGYGSACLAALDHYWQTEPDDDEIVVFVDADHSVKVSELQDLLVPLSHGCQFVVGCRNNGKQDKGALTPQQRFGNALATALIRAIWQQPVNDLGPFRAIRAGSLRKLAMQDPAFGWTVEMQVRAIQQQLKTVEVPVSSLRRIGQSKISGTVIGSIRAGHGILSMVFKLWWQQRKQQLRLWWAEA